MNIFKRINVKSLNYSVCTNMGKNLILYRKSIHKIQNNSTKQEINKYNGFLMRCSEKTCFRLNENRTRAVAEVCNPSSEYFYDNYLTNAVSL